MFRNDNNCDDDRKIFVAMTSNCHGSI